LAGEVSDKLRDCSRWVASASGKWQSRDLKVNIDCRLLCYIQQHTACLYSLYDSVKMYTHTWHIHVYSQSCDTQQHTHIYRYSCTVEGSRFL